MNAAYFVGVDTLQPSRAVGVIKLSAAVYLVVSSAIIIFGLNVPAIWQGMLGIIGSLEGYYGAESAEPRRVLFFLAILVPCVVVSLTLGVLALTGNNLLVNCNSSNKITLVVQNSTTSNSSVNAQEFFNCSTSYQLYGYVELFGGAGVGLLCFIVVASAMRPLRRDTALREAKRAELERTTISLPRLLS